MYLHPLQFSCTDYSERIVCVHFLIPFPKLNFIRIYIHKYIYISYKKNVSFFFIFQLHGQRNKLSTETIPCGIRQGSLLGQMCQYCQPSEHIYATNQLGSQLLYGDLYRIERGWSQHRISNLIIFIIIDKILSKERKNEQTIERTKKKYSFLIARRKYYPPAHFE